MPIPMLKDLIKEQPSTYKRVAGVVVKSEGKVLLVRRAENAGRYPNFWAVPMGGVEPGEKFKQAAHREFKEETMLDIDINSLVYLDMLKDGIYKRVLALFTIELPNQPEPTLDHEHSDWGYFNPKYLPTPIQDDLRYTLELKI